MKALEEGADIVVGGRVADASLAVGPAAWWHGWKGDDWDKLAGATTAGHIIECGAQATGGNYSFIDEVPSFENVGFPLAEIAEDGSFVVRNIPARAGSSRWIGSRRSFLRISSPRSRPRTWSPVLTPSGSAGKGQTDKHRLCPGRTATATAKVWHQNPGRVS